MTREATDLPPDDLATAFAAIGQDHVFRFWAKLDGDQQERFERELREVDLPQVADLLAVLGRGDETGPQPTRRTADVVSLGDSLAGHDREEARRTGERVLSEGKVGIFLVAGGQGTRLGFDGPKGCLPVAPLSNKTLFCLHAEKIARLASRYGVQPPWYIMTSEANDEATRSFFAEHDYFGLGVENVWFFRQRMLPALDDDGKLILSSPGTLFRGPNGHGGSYQAFLEGGALEDARHRGIEHLFYFQVDNPLIRIPDPVFLGFHVLGESEYSLKVLAKTGPDEKVGIVALEENRPCIVEYSDLPLEEAQARDASGRLLHWAGTIAIHIFTMEFFERVARGAIPLPLHLARKSVPTIDADGKGVEVQGNKFEMFVFDSLRHADRTLNLEVVREEEFAPVKNRTGVDSLESGRRLLVAEHRRWLEAAGVSATGTVEVSPRVAVEAEDLHRELEGTNPQERYEGNLLVERDASGRVVIELRDRQEA